MDIPSFPPTDMPTWASYVEGRRPQFKLHRHKGLAKNAIMYPRRQTPHGGGVIYQFVNGEWEVYYVFEQNWECYICGELIEDEGLTRVQAQLVDGRAPRDQLRFVHRAMPNWRDRVGHSIGTPRERVIDHDYGPCVVELRERQRRQARVEEAKVFEE